MKAAVVRSSALGKDWNVDRLIADASTHHKEVCPCEECVKYRLIQDACKAKELFGLEAEVE